jgi:hypothetical protein
MGVRWPGGKDFAFTIFDDPDAQTLAVGQRIYGFLAEHGFATTRGVWPSPAVRTPNSGGDTCDDPRYLAHTQALQAAGFEVGFHNATKHSSTRAETIRGLDGFERMFGRAPRTMANHYNAEAIYWGPARVSPPVRTLYTLVTRGRTRSAHFGHVEGNEWFWGDVCRERITYCRNFVFPDINTLAACPQMPYHDPERPYVQAWYASSDGATGPRFVEAIAEANQDRLEAEGGACIMYTHFGLGFVDGRTLNRRFERLMTRLRRKNGWFVPVSTLLDYLGTRQEQASIDAAERRSLEWRWLSQKLLRGTS